MTRWKCDFVKVFMLGQWINAFCQTEQMKLKK